MKDAKDMSDKELNIAIALFKRRQLKPSFGSHNPDQKSGMILGVRGPGPDCCRDLNAMHELEMGMNDGLYEAYRYKLSEIIGDDDNFYTSRDYLSAKARQRAEAFYNTVIKKS